MALTDTFIRNIKSTGKIQKILDGDGLYIHVNPKGLKFWRIRFCVNGKRNSISLGQYPYISLAEARKQLFITKEMLAKGINPSIHKKAVKNAHNAKSSNGFEIIGREWHSKQMNSWTQSHAKRILNGLEKDVFSSLGSLPIEDITAPYPA